jgi:uncharacterized protein
LDEIIERVAPADLTIRGGDGRTVYGLAVPYDREATVNDGYGAYREVFRHGAFARTLNAGMAERVKFYTNHSHRQNKLPIGRAISLREDTAGLVGEFYVSDTRDGNEALELVRDRVLDSFSVGFAKVKERADKSGLVERLEVKLKEVSLVAHPAYEGALVAGLRQQLTDEEIERLMAFAHDLATQRSELAESTSLRDPAETQDDSEAGHSSRTPTREQRIAARIFRGITNDQNHPDSSAA